MSQSFQARRPLEPAEPPRSRPRRARLLLLLCLAALIGPCAAYQAPREVGRWHLAFALRHWEGGQREEAYVRLAAAERWLPGSPELLLQRAAWRLDERDIDAALSDADRAVELSPGELQPRIYRSHILQRAGRHAESKGGRAEALGRYAAAIADWQAIAEMSASDGPRTRAMALNGLAYARAVGNLELDLALANVNEALSLEASAGVHPAYLDTRGYIHYLQQRYDRAIGDLDMAVSGMEALLAADVAGQQPVVEPHFEDFSPQRTLAVVRFHRALALLALGREQEAKGDLDRVRELIGGEPDESLF